MAAWFMPMAAASACRVVCAAIGSAPGGAGGRAQRGEPCGRIFAGRAGARAEAGEAVLAHIRRSCRGANQALAEATRIGPWLAAGPIRPGIRLERRRGIFPVGNVAGEAHPVVAEGISMALQGARLLAQRLCDWDAAGRPRAALLRVHQEYAADWRRRFA